jgi:sugar phosphate isomerase/epimerase
MRMADALLFGIQTNGIKHTHDDPMPDIDTRFRMVRDAGVFDYVDKTPEPHEVEAFAAASQKYGLPVRGSGWFYTLGEHEALMRSNLETARQLGSVVHNVQIRTCKADGSMVTNDEVAACYLWAQEQGERVGVMPCFEVHVNMWSEDFRRVADVARAVEEQGVPFCMTLDHSHVIFKMNNPLEQEIQNMRPAVESGELVLDPFQDGNVIDRWIHAGWIRHCHARAAVPCNPKNLTGHHEDGSVGRGIQYPFKRPAPGEYHAEWHEEALEPWKEALRHLLRHHAADAEARLGQISTEFIPGPDYGMGCRYSLFEQAVACVEWMRGEWDRARSESVASPGH